MEFAVLATLPLGLLSLFVRMRGAHAGIGFLAALAPVLAKGALNLFGRKSKQKDEQRQQDFERQKAMQEQEQARARFEAQQNSPEATLRRLGFNTKLSRILGKFGGRESTPAFILNAFDKARARQEFVPGAGFLEKPGTSSGLFDVAGDFLSAADMFDVEGFKKGRAGGGGGGGGGEAAPSGPPPPSGPSAAAPGVNAALPSEIRRRQRNLGGAPQPQEPNQPEFPN